MDKEQGQIWYERAQFYATTGSKANAEKAYSIARNYDPTLPPLPKFRNHAALKTLEYVCLIVGILFLAWLVYLLAGHPPGKAGLGFKPWSITLRGSPTDVAEPAGLEPGKGTQAVIRQSGTESALYTRQYQAIKNTTSGESPVHDSSDSGTTAPGLLVSNTPNTTGTLVSPVGATASTSPRVTGQITQEETPNLETFTLLRNALYYYTSDRTEFPDTLKELVSAGYLDAIPVEPVSGLNRVSKSFTGRGGWVYCPPPALIPAKTCEQIEMSLYPNHGTLTRYPFLPQTLRVNLSKAKMILFEGITPRKSWPVSFGAQASPTPEGKFRIIEKEALTGGIASTYGTRWLQLGERYPVGADVNPSGRLGNQNGSLIPDNTSPTDGSTDSLASRGIGIHGTDGNAAVGLPITNGCVRMRNTDVEELYRLVPNGVRVWIDR